MSIELRCLQEEGSIHVGHFPSEAVAIERVKGDIAKNDGIGRLIGASNGTLYYDLFED